jgi:hypothetical protein
VANYWKNRAGTIASVKENGTIADKQKAEEIYQQWAENQKVGNYKNVLGGIKKYYETIAEKGSERNYSAQFQRNVKYLIIPFRLGSALDSYFKQDAAAQGKMLPKIKENAEAMYERFVPALEKEMLQTMAELYQSRVNADYQLPVMKFTNAEDLALKSEKSIFSSKETLMKFLENPTAEALHADPLYSFANLFIAEYSMSEAAYEKANDEFAENTRIYLDGLQKSQPEKLLYPDANSTMRLTNGKISTLPFRKDRNYNGVKNNFYTDMAGLVAKYKKGDAEFDVPQRLLDLYKKKDFCPYKDKKGYMPINFLSDNDITGGNSGSPIMNGDGELIGLAFDGNSEALSGDIVFEAQWQKTINVDVRYVLWIIDKFAGAQNIIDELDIRK